LAVSSTSLFDFGEKKSVWLSKAHPAPCRDRCCNPHEGCCWRPRTDSQYANSPGPRAAEGGARRIRGVTDKCKTAWGTPGSLGREHHGKRNTLTREYRYRKCDSAQRISLARFIDSRDRDVRSARCEGARFRRAAATAHCQKPRSWAPPKAVRASP